MVAEFIANRSDVYLADIIRADNIFTAENRNCYDCRAISTNENHDVYDAAVHRLGEFEFPCRISFILGNDEYCPDITATLDV